MEDWEDQPAPLVLKEQTKNLWDEEDVDENDIKESWEDEDEPAPAPVAEPPAEKPPKKFVAKASDKKGKAVEVVKEEALDPKKTVATVQKNRRHSRLCNTQPCIYIFLYIYIYIYKDFKNEICYASVSNSSELLLLTVDGSSSECWSMVYYMEP